MEQTRDQVSPALAEIHERLLSSPRDDFSRRSDLKEGQNELRQLSHGLVEDRPLYDAAVMRAAFDRLQALRDHLPEERIFTGPVPSVGDAGIESDFTAWVNKAIEAGMEIDKSEARLQRTVRQMRSPS